MSTSTQAATTSINNLTNITTTTTINDNDTTVYYDDTLDIVLPFVVGLFVALALGWMVIRYKMTTQKTSNYSGSIYCCPERCFTSMSRFRKRRVFPSGDKHANSHNRERATATSNHHNKNNRASQISIISNNEFSTSYDSFRVNMHRKSTIASSNGYVPSTEYPLRTLRRDTLVPTKANNMPNFLFKFSAANFKSSFPNFQRNNTSDDIL